MLLCNENLGICCHINNHLTLRNIIFHTVYGECLCISFVIVILGVLTLKDIKQTDYANSSMAVNIGAIIHD